MARNAAVSQLAHAECLYSVVDVSVNTTTVYDGPCLFYGIFVNTTLSAHVLPVLDDTASVMSLAASAAAGTNVSFAVGIRIETKLVVDPNDAATGSVTVAYMPLDA